MDFPVFHLDFFGNRLLIAVIATVHVLINHALAVGAIPLIALLEWKGWRSGDARWDRLAYRMLFTCFIVTTTLGALTGVGIWFSTSLVNPAAIGSLLRVFFWAWFTEWLVFVGEVGLILAYFLTWKGWGQRHKPRHIAMGAGLTLFSWLTMAVIVAVLGFQMDTGVWTLDPGFRSAFLNPLYLPQLFFRTPFAMVAAGMFGLALIPWFTEGVGDFRPRAVRVLAGWTLGWSVLWLAGALTYWRAVPEAMVSNLEVALATLPLQDWSNTLLWLIGGAVGMALLVSLWGVVQPRRLPTVVLLMPFLLAMWLLGYFERVREFIRKPDVIAAYMYSNGLRASDYPLFAQDGLLQHAAYSSVREVTPENELEAGREMFRLACSRCHTTTGVNSVVAKLSDMYGEPRWDPEMIENFLATLHNVRRFMPPVPGTEAERTALAAYLVDLQHSPERLPGAQTAGLTRPAD